MEENQESYFNNWFISKEINGIDNFDSIGKANILTFPGDTIFIQNGIYSGNDNSNFDVSGTPELIITYNCDPNAKIDTKVKVTGSNIIFNDITFLCEVLLEKCENVVFNNCSSPSFRFVNTYGCIINNSKKTIIILKDPSRCQVNGCAGKLEITGKNSKKYGCKIEEYYGSIIIHLIYCKIFKSTITNLVIQNSVGTFLDKCTYDDN